MLEKLMNMNVLLYGMAALGALGAVGMVATHFTYRRMLKNTNAMMNLREKWLNAWKTRDKMLGRMNRMVWYPSLFSTVLLGISVYLVSLLQHKEGLPLPYFYLGIAIPITLLLLRQALDVTGKEELALESLTAYMEHTRGIPEEKKEREEQNPKLREDLVEQITESIRQTAATGGHFSRMLSAEEEDIVREVIREFME